MKQEENVINHPMVERLLALEEIFRENKFKIPDYQRGYSWEEPQLNDLIKDIEHIKQKAHKHYTGTIVIAKGKEKDRFEIVDGQQRLTTFIILLNLIYETDKVKYAAIKDLFLYRGDKDYVLETNAETNQYFKEAILGEKKNLPVSIKPLKNLKFAKDFLRTWINQNNQNIDCILKTITEKFGFICFAPENTNEMGIMFEVINNRGKSLSELEKIKNYFIYYATINGKNSLRTKINENWGTILKYLSLAGITSNDDENNFLRNCYIVFYSSNKSRSWYVYDELKEKYKPEDNQGLNDKIQEIENFIDFIQEAAQNYAFFYNKATFLQEYNGVNKNEIAGILKRLRCHPVNASIFPLYIASMSYLHERPEDVLKLLDLLEKANFRIYVLPNAKISRSDSRQGEFFGFAHDLYCDREWESDADSQEYYTVKNRKITGDIFGYATMMISDLVLELCPEEVFVQSLTVDNDEAIDFYHWAGIRFFLASYEEKLNERRKESWDIERILITRDETKNDKGNDYLSREHIWAVKNRIDDFPADVKEKRRLGNFVLLGLSSNIQLQNEDIDIKVDKLLEYNAISMQQVLNLKKYLEDATKVALQGRVRRTKYYYSDIALSLIDQRENDLIKFALERWLMDGENFNKFIKVDSFEATGNEYYFLKEKNESKK